MTLGYDPCAENTRRLTPLFARVQVEDTPGLAARVVDHHLVAEAIHGSAIVTGQALGQHEAEAAVEGAIDTAKEVVEGVVEVATEVVDSAKDIASEVVEGVKDVVEEILDHDSESEEEATE